MFSNKRQTGTISFYLKSSGSSNALWLLFSFLIDIQFWWRLLLKDTRSLIVSHTNQNHYLHVRQNKGFIYINKDFEERCFRVNFKNFKKYIFNNMLVGGCFIRCQLKCKFCQFSISYGLFFKMSGWKQASKKMHSMNFYCWSLFLILHCITSILYFIFM